MPNEEREGEEQSSEEAPREREFEAIRERDEPLTKGRADEHGDEDVVARESEAAAAEAGAIGGDAGTEAPNEADRGVLEHGGSEAEGFEQAEDALVDQAEHGEGRDPSADEYLVAEEAQHDSAAHGEADRLRSTESRAEREGEDTERE